MPLPSFTNKTDLVDIIYAADVNNLQNEVAPTAAASAHVRYSTSYTSTTNVTWTDSDMPVQTINFSSNSSITFPAVSTSNHPFYFINASTASIISLLASGGSTLNKVQPGALAFVYPDSTAGFKTLSLPLASASSPSTTQYLNVIGMSTGELAWTAKSLFDTTAPSSASAAASAGTATTAAHRDHSHIIPSYVDINTSTSVSVTTTDITGAEGKTYNLDISGLTANRNITLPVATGAGAQITININTGDDTYFLIIKGAATVTIDGGAAATEWHRLQTTGASATFRATSTTNWKYIGGTCDEKQITMTPFLQLPPLTGSNFFAVFAFTRPCQVTRVEFNYFISSGLSTANYWTVRIDDNGGTVSGSSVTINSGATATWVRGTAFTSFTKSIFVGSDIHLLAYATKTGTPGDFYGTISAVVRLA